MKVLKSKTFGSDKLVAYFVNENQIAREDIVIITCTGDIAIPEYAIFFYGEPDLEEKKKGFWG